ncbi:FHA domain-containing protein [Luteolibacter sp. AS25]|uniref:FHA domain-containing protein n=1 Tax=Luteolibacter sp. AS25 TaxID=3135776 RepID=UPI00398BAF9E
MPRVIITVPERDAQPYRFQLDRKSVSIGRGSDNDIVLDSGSVSGRHAEMRRVEGGYELVDCGSTNGIKYDGRRVDAVALQSGMEVKLGDVSFLFDLSDEERSSLELEAPRQEAPVVQERSLPRPPPRRRQAQPQDDSYRPPAKQSRYQTKESAGMGLGSIVMFLLLTAAAFFGGLYVRHEKDTGVSLIHAMGNKGNLENASPVAEPPAANPAQ